MAERGVLGQTLTPRVLHMPSAVTQHFPRQGHEGAWPWTRHCHGREHVPRDPLPPPTPTPSSALASLSHTPTHPAPVPLHCITSHPSYNHLPSSALQMPPYHSHFLPEPLPALRVSLSP